MKQIQNNQMEVWLEKPAAAQPAAQLSEEVPRRAYTIPCLVHCRGVKRIRAVHSPACLCVATTRCQFLRREDRTSSILACRPSILYYRRVRGLRPAFSARGWDDFGWPLRRLHLHTSGYVLMLDQWHHQTNLRDIMIAGWTSLSCARSSARCSNQ